MKTIKSLMIMGALMAGSIMAAQNVKPSFEKEGDLIKGVFYYENGNIRQEGTYKEGKLHGQWISYDENGKKTAIAQYEKGEKSGKWFFWNADKLTEVDYSHNQIADVTEYSNTSGIAINN